MPAEEPLALNAQQQTELEELDFGPEVTGQTSSRLKIDNSWRSYLNRGSLSNLATFLILILGVIIILASPKSVIGNFILSFGLFGFSGGITNWLAVKMLFDRVLFLPGSGVIPAKFKEIRQTVKNVMMETFFDEKYMKKYLAQKGPSLFSKLNLTEKLKKMLQSDTVDKAIDENLRKFGQSQSQEAQALSMMLGMMGKSVVDLKPIIQPFILNMADDMGPIMEKNFSNLDEIFDINSLRTEIDSLMTEKLKELDAETVKNLLENVIRTHLGWLILWGNVFGGLIGIVSTAVYYLF